MKTELPEKYYLDYYRIVLQNVKQKYYYLLLAQEQAFLDRLLDISENALCLWIRMANRKKHFYINKDLNYKEIDIESAKKELLENSLIVYLSSYHTKEIAHVLTELKKADLVDILTKIEQKSKGFFNKLSKIELLNWVQKYPQQQAIINLLIEKKFIFCEFKELDKFIKYLYFGYISTDLTPFVLRDLGNIKFEDYDEQMLVPRFENRTDIEAAWTIAQAQEYFYFLQKNNATALEIYHWFEEWNRHLKPNEWFDFAKRRYDKLVLKMAKLLERSKQIAYALQVYALTKQPPAKERQARIYYKWGNREKAQDFCLDMLKNYDNIQEKYFAQYFLKKIEGEKILLPTTAYLKKADTIILDKKWKYRPEEGLVHYYLEKNELAIHTENWIWRSLLGLVLWEVIFDSNDSAISSPFQRIPSNFLSKNYYLNRKDKIDTAFEIIKQPKQFKNHIQTIFDNKFGIANPLVYWHERILLIIETLYNSLQTEQLLHILHTMISDPANNTKGFPDLAVWDNKGGLRLIEVKSPTDNLSFQQLFWLEFFTKIGVEACAEKVVYQ